MENLTRLLQTETFIDAVEFNNDVTTYTSESIRCASFSNFLLLIDKLVTGTPTDILIEIEFSDDNTNWRKYMRGPFGDLRYEDSAGTENESIGDKCQGAYMRVKATATGTSAVNTFTLTVKANLTR